MSWLRCTILEDICFPAGGILLVNVVDGVAGGHGRVPLMRFAISRMISWWSAVWRYRIPKSTLWRFSARTDFSALSVPFSSRMVCIKPCTSLYSAVVIDLRLLLLGKQYVVVMLSDSKAIPMESQKICLPGCDHSPRAWYEHRCCDGLDPNCTQYHRLVFSSDGTRITCGVGGMDEVYCCCFRASCLDVGRQVSTS